MCLGIASTRRSKISDLKRKEDGWENRIILTPNLEDLNRKSKARAEIDSSMLQSSFDRKYSDRGKPASSRPRTAPGGGKSRANRSPHVPSHSNSYDSKPRSHRVDFAGVSENDLIANGLYYLDDAQMEVYDNFTSLLACHDQFDMVSWSRMELIFVLWHDIFTYQ